MYTFLEISLFIRLLSGRVGMSVVRDVDARHAVSQVRFDTRRRRVGLSVGRRPEDLFGS